MYTYDGSSCKTMICSLCNIKMKPGKVTLSYLGSTFPVELNRCEKCGMVYIPEELATGKMDQVEKTLEDK